MFSAADNPFPSSLDWRTADDRLAFLARGRHQLDHETGRALLEAKRARAHEHLGFGSFCEYVERRFGFGPRYTRERLRVALALEELPRTDEALMEGTLSWSAAREITRVAEDWNEQEWLDRARALSQRQLERLVARHVKGERPSDPPHPDARRHVLRFDLSGHAMALWREVAAKVREEVGEDLEDDELLVQVCRRVLEGPKEEGRAGYQMTVATCPECRETTQLGRGDLLRVDAADVEMMQCDAQRIDEKGHASQEIPPAVRRQVLARDLRRCCVPGCRNSIWLDVHHLVLRSEGGGHDMDGLVTLCGTHHRAQHQGRLIIEGRPSTGLSFRHADGSAYGGGADPHIAGLAADAFEVLRKWGVTESQAKRAVAAAVPQLGRHSDVGDAIRIALTYLRRGG